MRLQKKKAVGGGVNGPQYNERGQIPECSRRYDCSFIAAGSTAPGDRQSAFSPVAGYKKNWRLDDNDTMTSYAALSKFISRMPVTNFRRRFESPPSFICEINNRFQLTGKSVGGKFFVNGPSKSTVKTFYCIKLTYFKISSKQCFRSANIAYKRKVY